MSTMQFEDIGYLEQDYLDQDYQSGLKLGTIGHQFKVIIDKSKASGFQFDANIIDKLKAEGFQFQSEIKDNPEILASEYLSNIIDSLAEKGSQYQGIINLLKTHGFQALAEIDKTSFGGFQFLNAAENQGSTTGTQFRSIINTLINLGFQFHIVINKENSNGAQFLSNILNKKTTRGFQFEISIDDQKAFGVEFRKDAYQTYSLSGYLEDAYLSDPYLTGYFAPRFPTQFNADLGGFSQRGFQYLVNVIDASKVQGSEFEAMINSLKINGFQFKIINSKDKKYGFQFESGIVDFLGTYGTQFLTEIVAEKAAGFQYEVIAQIGIGFQFLATVYNTKNLRILHNFKSRGLTNTNWTSNSQMVGDFSANNFDSDIVEYVWRSESGVKTGIRLTCDVGLNQVCYVDTLAILNHNMTVGADIVFLMSNDPLFISGTESIIIRPRRNDTYYIAPELPIAGYRYFRVQIDDPSNSNDYIEIGNIMFGAADIIHGENFTDEVDFEMVDYSDTITTEGYTNVANSRALKRKLTLNFESLNYEKRNYEILRNVFQTYRTTHKCLWIPTPDVLNQNLTDRFRIFGKLVTVPKERHNNKGGGADYVSFTVDLDEAL